MAWLPFVMFVLHTRLVAEGRCSSRVQYHHLMDMPVSDAASGTQGRGPGARGGYRTTKSTSLVMFACLCFGVGGCGCACLVALSCSISQGDLTEPQTHEDAEDDCPRYLRLMHADSSQCAAITRTPLLSPPPPGVSMQELAAESSSLPWEDLTANLDELGRERALLQDSQDAGNRTASPLSSLCLTE